MSFLAFWNLNTVHSLDSGAKIYDAQTLFVALYIKYFASIYPLGASVLKHLIILECPTSWHLTQFFNFLSNPRPLPAPLYPPELILIGALLNS
jgi:hypothetical protein